ncbi:MAG: sporulation protein YqfC [Clostridia bacterium]|nr:sporulation protein YqfC [Clostridia bacterium]MCI9275969.1 sporulation protein YqfC [Clostridia bacterium]
MGRRLNKLTALLEMPEEVMTDKPKITVMGFEEVAIENYKNILEYDEIFIKVNTYIGVINISGIGLKLIQMNKDDIMVVR